MPIRDRDTCVTFLFDLLCTESGSCVLYGVSCATYSLEPTGYTPTRLQLLAQLVAVELHIHTRYRRIPYYITYSITVRTLTDLWIRFALAKPKRKSQKKDVGVGSW